MTNPYTPLGLLFILVGPTGAGKNTLMNEVLSQMKNLRQLPTATTRAIRPNEQEGREHFFLTREAFENMIENHELLEWENVHGRLYGVPRHAVETAIQNGWDRIADIDVLGAMNVRRAFPDNTIIIFVQPGASEDVEQTVRERLKQRGETDAEIENRLKRVKMEMGFAPLCDYLVINDKLETAIETLKSIIIAEHSRRQLIQIRQRQGIPHHPIVYTTAVVISYQNQIWLKESTIPQVHLVQGELPHEAIHRVTHGLNLTPPSQFTAPTDITLNVAPYAEELTFWYHIPLTDPIDPQPDWKLSPSESVQLPDKMMRNLNTPSDV